MERQSERRCANCNKWFWGSGPQILCKGCKEIVHDERLSVSKLRRARPPLRNCLNCNKVLHPNNPDKFCNLLCEKVYATMEAQHGTVQST